ncbi:LapB repeat-containing protein [Listeria monocytogenes]|nr:LapB repeat-containing protein [Listeria monocytogenes]
MSIKSKIFKIGICGVMIMIPLSQISFPSFAAEEPGLKASQDIVNIPDPELKKELNRNFSNHSPDSDITEAQMASITYLALECDSTEITDLTGLEYLKNVQTLSLFGISASLEPIKNLTTLKSIYIYGATNLTSDMIPEMSALTNLDNLSILDTKIDNATLPKISNLPNLTRLQLENNLGITKLNGLTSLPKLTDLTITFSKIDDFSGVEKFPNLTNFNGEQQRFETAEYKNIKSSQLTFDATAQTLFFPFSLLDKQTILNFDGTPLLYSVNPADHLVETDSSYVVADNKMSINQQGITFSGFTQADFDSLNVFYAFVCFDGLNVSKPANLANGTYNINPIYAIEGFNIDHSVSISAEDASYVQGDTVTPEQFLKDIKAEANGATITSDFADKVDFTKPGTYKVTLNASNTVGLKAEPVQVTVTIVEKTVITAEPEVSYDLNTTKSEADFLTDIKAATNDSTAITTDFVTAVDLTKAGEYTVTLNAENEKQKATPLKVTVKVKEPTLVPNPTPTPTPTPTPEPGKDPTSESSTDGSIVSSDSSNAEKPGSPLVFFSASVPKTETKALPKTGDSLPVTGVVAGFLALGLGVLITRKK